MAVLQAAAVGTGVPRTGAQQQHRPACPDLWQAVRCVRCVVSPNSPDSHATWTDCLQTPSRLAAHRPPGIYVMYAASR